MAKDKNSYNSIVKSIGLFGGVKFFDIVIGVLKNKLVAVLIGPTGMGIVGILTSNIQMISSLTGFGLETSSVRDVAKTYENGNIEETRRVITVLKKLVVGTGLLGVILTFCFASYLSQISFGSNDYTWAFRVLSITLLFTQLKIGQTVIMQGTFHYKYMARSNMLGAFLSLILSVPLYYLYGVNAIVPVIVVTIVSALFASWFYSRKIIIPKIKLHYRDVLSQGKVMLTLGIAIAVTGFLSIGITYLQRIFIANIGTLADVGMYTAGITIATQYVNVILSAMGSDYAPRLASIAHDNVSFIIAVNKQAKMLITLVVPLIVPLIVFVRHFTILLYSERFVEVSVMIEWMMLGMFFRAISWTMSYTIIAKGKANTFFWNETLTQVYSLLFSILGYYWGRFEGIGIGFCLTYVCYTIQMFIVCKSMYGLRYSTKVLYSILSYLLSIVTFFILMRILGYGLYRYVVGSFFIFVVFYISFVELNRMISIKDIFNKFIHR